MSTTVIEESQVGPSESPTPSEQDVGIMKKFERSGMNSIVNTEGRFPAFEPYAFLAIGILVSLYMFIRGAIDKDSIGQILHSQSILWIILACLTIVSMFKGYQD